MFFLKKKNPFPVPQELEAGDCFTSWKVFGLNLFGFSLSTPVVQWPMKEFDCFSHSPEPTVEGWKYPEITCLNDPRHPAGAIYCLIVFWRPQQAQKDASVTSKAQNAALPLLNTKEVPKWYAARVGYLFNNRRDRDFSSVFYLGFLYFECTRSQRFPLHLTMVLILLFFFFSMFILFFFLRVYVQRNIHYWN